MLADLDYNAVFPGANVDRLIASLRAFAVDRRDTTVAWWAASIARARSNNERIGALQGAASYLGRTYSKDVAARYIRVALVEAAGALDPRRLSRLGRLGRLFGFGNDAWRTLYRPGSTEWNQYGRPINDYTMAQATLNASNNNYGLPKEKKDGSFVFSVNPVGKKKGAKLPEWLRTEERARAIISAIQHQFNAARVSISFDPATGDVTARAA